MLSPVLAGSPVQRKCQTSMMQTATNVKPPHAEIPAANRKSRQGQTGSDVKVRAETTSRANRKSRQGQSGSDVNVRVEFTSRSEGE